MQLWTALLFLLPLGHAEELDPAVLKMMEKLNCSTAAPQALPACHPSEEIPEGCSQKVEEFCNELYSTKNKGNIDLETSTGGYRIRLGADSSGLSHAFVFQMEAKLAARNQFPAELKNHLEKLGYFEQLESYLKLAKSENNTVATKISRDSKADILSTIWNQAIQLASVEAYEKDHPGFNQSDPIAEVDQVFFSDLKDDMQSEAYRATWETHPKWEKVKNDFEHIKHEYVKMLEQNKSLNETTKSQWIKKIQSVTLSHPGSDPGEKNNNDCGTTEINAYYKRNENVIRVCAGYFTSSEITRTLTHELSHAIDPGSNALDFTSQTDLFQDLYSLWEKNCPTSKSTQCDPEWKKIRDEIPQKLQNWESFKYPNFEFLECLQKKKLEEIPGKEIFNTMGDSIAKSDASIYSEKSSYLRRVKSELPNLNGKYEKNPRFLNSCSESKANRKNFSLDDALRFIFSEEYKCTNESLSAAKKLETAIDSSIKIQGMLNAAILKTGGKFSPYSKMINSDYSENVAERFADAMGSSVYARILEKLPKRDDRFKSFFGNIAGLCDPPSMAREFPEEYEVQKSFSTEPHSEGLARRNEILNAPIRKALGCQKDFEKKDCSL